MAIFNSYVSLPEGIYIYRLSMAIHGYPSLSYWIVTEHSHVEGWPCDKPCKKANLSGVGDLPEKMAAILILVPKATLRWATSIGDAEHAVRQLPALYVYVNCQPAVYTYLCSSLPSTSCFFTMIRLSTVTILWFFILENGGGHFINCRPTLHIRTDPRS